VARHPVGGTRFLEGIGELAVAEDVDEELAARDHPALEAPEELAVVPQVLEHLDRHDAVEALAELERVDVGDEVTDVRETAPLRLRREELALRPRVRDRRHRRARVALRDPEAHRPPATAEVEQRHPVRDTCPRAR